MDELVRRFAGLGDEDRRWLLAQMTPAQRRKLTSALGHDDGERRSADGDADAVQGGTIANAAVPDVAAVLAEEPAWVIAAVLAQRAWSWREQYLVALDGDRREDVVRALTGAHERIAEGARIAVIQCVEDKLRARAATMRVDGSFEVMLIQAEQDPPSAVRRPARWSWRSLWNR